MTTQPEALRLADAQECVTDDNCGWCPPCSVAAELRRLHAENETLLEALKELTGHTNKRFTGGVWDRARAAIKQAEENT